MIVTVEKFANSVMDMLVVKLEMLDSSNVGMNHVAILPQTIVLGDSGTTTAIMEKE